MSKVDSDVVRQITEAVVAQLKGRGAQPKRRRRGKAVRDITEQMLLRLRGGDAISGERLKRDLGCGSGTFQQVRKALERTGEILRFMVQNHIGRPFETFMCLMPATARQLQAVDTAKSQETSGTAMKAPRRIRRWTRDTAEIISKYLKGNPWTQARVVAAQTMLHQSTVYGCLSDLSGSMFQFREERRTVAPKDPRYAKLTRSMVVRLWALQDEVPLDGGGNSGAETPTPRERLAYTEEAAAPKVRLPRVAVVGPLPGQFTHIANRVRRVEPVYLDKDASPSSCGQYDAAVIWTRFSGHGWTETLINQLGRSRVHLVSGGIGEVIRNVDRSV